MRFWRVPNKLQIFSDRTSAVFLQQINSCSSRIRSTYPLPFDLLYLAVLAFRPISKQHNRSTAHSNQILRSLTSVLNHRNVRRHWNAYEPSVSGQSFFSGTALGNPVKRLSVISRHLTLKISIPAQITPYSVAPVPANFPANHSLPVMARFFAKNFLFPATSHVVFPEKFTVLTCSAACVCAKP